MSVPVVGALLLGVVLVALGWPSARVVSGSRTWALAVTPAAAGLVVSAAVAVSVLTGTSMVPWLVLAVAVGWALVLRRRAHPAVSDVAGPDAWVLAAAALVALVPVLLVNIPPVESDARYIWWFHAAWFRGGGDITRDGMGNPNFAFSRPRYPPLLPGVIASVWQLGRPYDPALALRVSQLFTAAAIAAAGFHTALVSRLSRRGGAVVAAAVAAVCWGANAGVGLVGFVDLAWAALFVSAAVLLLAAPIERRTVAVGTVFAAAAAMVKFEAQVAAVLLVVLVLVRAGREWRQVLPVVAGVLGAIAAWQVVVTVAGAAPDERGDWSQLAHLLDSGAEVHDRFTTAAAHLAGELGPLVGLAVLGILVAVAVARWSGLPLRQPGSVMMLVLCAGYFVALALTFAVAPEDLEPYLDVAAYRTVIVVRILVLVDVALVWLALARSIGLLERPPAYVPEPARPRSGSLSSARRWLGDLELPEERPTPRGVALILTGLVVLRAGIYAVQGAGLVLDDWSIIGAGGIARLWHDPNTPFALSRPGAWVLLTVVNGGIGAHPLVLLAVLSGLQLAAAWMIYRVALRWVSPVAACAIPALWILMPNHSSLTVWGPTIPALVALCLLLAGVLQLGAGRWATATACLCVGALCYEAVLPAALVATLVLPATPPVSRQRRAVTLALLTAIALWIRAHPLYITAVHLPPFVAFWDAHFGRGVLGNRNLASTAPVLLEVATAVGVVVCVFAWWRGDRARGRGPGVVVVGLAVCALGAMGWLTLRGLRTPLGNLDRILVVSSIGAAAIWVGIIQTAWERFRLATGLAVAGLVLACLSGQVVTLGSWSRAGADVVALLDHVRTLDPHPADRDFVVGPTPVLLDHNSVFGVFTEGFADNAFTYTFGDGPGSLTVAGGPTTFTTDGRGTLLDWSDVLGGDVISYRNLVADAPLGALDAAVVESPGRLRLTGWALDPSDPSAGVDVVVRVDSSEVDIGPTRLPRPDIPAAIPWADENHGFDATVEVGPGRHLVCSIARNIGGGSDDPLLVGDTPTKTGAWCIETRPQ